MTYLTKDTMKKLKKAKSKPEEDVIEKKNVDSDEKVEQKNDVKKFNIGKDLKQKLVAENGYISDMLAMVVFPKRAESDDDGKFSKETLPFLMGTLNVFLYNSRTSKFLQTIIIHTQ